MADRTHRMAFGGVAQVFKRAIGLLPLVAALMLWQIFGDEASVYFPPPSQWVRAAYTDATQGSLWSSVAETLSTFVIGLFMCIVVGTLVGTLLGRAVQVDRALTPFLEFLRTLPAGALVPVAVIVIGYTDSMSVAVVVATAVWPILLNVRQGAKSISQIRLDAGATLHLGRGARFIKIVMPSVFGSALVGTRIAAPVVLIIVILVEILTQVPGIGQELAVAQQTYKSALVYALVVLAGIFGTLINWLLIPLARVGERFGLTSSVM